MNFLENDLKLTGFGFLANVDYVVVMFGGDRNPAALPIREEFYSEAKHEYVLMEQAHKTEKLSTIFEMIPGRNNIHNQIQNFNYEYLIIIRVHLLILRNFFSHIFSLNKPFSAIKRYSSKVSPKPDSILHTLSQIF